MADILRSILQSINKVITLIEKRDLQLNEKQCRCLVICVKQVKDSLFSKPIRVHRQLLGWIWRTIKNVEIFVAKCCNKDWLVNTLFVGVSEEEIKGFILELGWCLNHVAKLEDQGHESQIQWTPPQMVLPSEEDIRHDRQSLVNKLHNFLSGTRVGCEKRDLALYLEGRLKILEGEGKCKPSLKRLLWKLKLPEPSKYEHLGRGASALVFKTSWLGIPSAMKSLSCCGDKFLREAGILAMLNHPNIVKLYCCYEDRKHQSLVMELMDESLYDLLRERRKSRINGSPFELEEAVEILLQIVKGMLYLHKHGFAHRDLKSLNILVIKPKGSQACFSTSDLIVKVADFELVKLFDPTSSKVLTVSQKKAGTHVWRAPEVLEENAKINPKRADIYSFAMVFYEILTGEIPFEHSRLTKEELHKKIVYEEFRPSLPKDCPEKLSTLIKECWNADPELRPTFEEIYDRLLRFRALLMMETSVIVTQDVRIVEEFAITRAMTPFVKMWEFLLSLCMNKHQQQISNALQQVFSYRMKPFIKMWEFLLSLGTDHKEVDAQTSNRLQQRLERLSPEEALDELDEEINQVPNDIHALSLRAEVRLRLQDLKGSLADLDEMNVLQPNDGVTLKSRGEVKCMLGDYEGALKDLDDAMKLLPNDSCLLIPRAQAKKVLKDYDGALKDLNAADHLAPHDVLILSLRGEMKKNLEDFTGALQDLNEALDLAPHDVTILNEIAHVNQMWDAEYARKRCKETSAQVDSENARRRKSCGCQKWNCPLCTMYFCR